MKYEIKLSDVDRTLLHSLVHKDTEAVRILRRCEMLLQADQGVTDVMIARQVGCSVNCVANLRKRYASGGLDRALYDAPRSGAPQKFTASQLKEITQLAAGEPPPGRKRWTIELVCTEAAKRGIVNSISVGRVYTLLKKRDASRS